MRPCFEKTDLLISEARRDYKKELFQVRAWWEQTYKMPSQSNPLFEDNTLAETVKHLLCRHFVNGGDVVFEDGVLSIMTEEEASAFHQRVTNDPVIDKWERLVAKGIDPFTGEPMMEAKDGS